MLLTQLFSISDMTLKLWDMNAEECLLDSFDHHTEFVVGLDFNIFVEGIV